MPKRTALYEQHLAAHAKLVDFAGWEMPIHYGSQLAEHQQVRENAGIFDVSHMRVIDIEGPAASSYLGQILANDVGRLAPGKALYSCMLNEAGGILDDLIAYQISPEFYRLVVNAGTAEKDLAWMRQQVKNAHLTLKERSDLAIIATQGPKAAEKIATLFPKQATQLTELKPFHFLIIEDKFIARTGYTGEDGFEWIVPVTVAAGLWQQFVDAGFTPAGLGARDTLRLEAGLNLYGNDMDESVTPLESHLAWTVAWEPKTRQFIGRQALEKQLAATPQRQLVGLVLEQSGIPRHHQKVLVPDLGEGQITSGSFSPTLKMGIALARVPVGQYDHCSVEIRDKKISARVVKLPFVKKGKKMF